MRHIILVVTTSLLPLISWCDQAVPSSGDEKLEIQFEWSFINFTWPSMEVYEDAISTKTYIPENNCLTGLKIFENTSYVSLPRARQGTPVTLAVVSSSSKTKRNPLLQPYPNWDMNKLNKCDALQSVQSMEIDSKGIMWVIDGHRVAGQTRCPPKIVLLDLKNNGNVLHVVEVPKELCPLEGCFLNDIVVDEDDGGFAFITEHSATDPGLLIFSLEKNKLWKARDKSMFAEDVTAFSVGNKEFNKLGNVDGIALSPKGQDERLIYYCSLTGYNQYAIKADVLKNEQLLKSNEWRRKVKLLGRKFATSDGLVADNVGNLYFTFINNHSIGKWNTSLPLNANTVQVYNNSKMLWPDTFAFDDDGWLYVTATQVNKYFDQSYSIEMNDEIKIRIFKLRTNTKSYLF